MHLTGIINAALAPASGTGADVIPRTVAVSAVSAPDSAGVEYAEAVARADDAQHQCLERMACAVAAGDVVEQRIAVAAAYVVQARDALIKQGQPEQQAKIRAAELRAILLCYAHGAGNPLKDAKVGGAQRIAKVARQMLKGAGLLQGRQRQPKQEQAEEVDPREALKALLADATVLAQSFDTALATSIRNILDNL